MTRLRLLGTDFDGTLSDPFARSPATSEAFARLRQLIHQLRFRHGMKWAIVTGRHVESIPVITGELMMYGLVPDFLVMEDAHIFARHGSAYRPFWWWNFQLRHRRQRQLKKYRTRVLELGKAVEQQYPHLQNLAAGRLIDFWYAFSTEHDAVAVEHRLQQEFRDNPDFFVFRWGLEVCLVPTAGTKGEAVNRLARHLSLSPAEIATIGDGANDISMLNGSCAHHPACVGNADDAVRETVSRAGGYVAQANVVHGVLEFLQRFHSE